MNGTTASLLKGHTSVTINFIVLKILCDPYEWYYSFTVERSHICYY
jgi:hypothetical protein